MLTKTDCSAARFARIHLMAYHHILRLKLVLCLCLVLLFPAMAAAALSEKIVYSKQVDADNSDLWLMNPDGTNPVRLTSLPGHEFYPQISPDGAKIAFVSNASGAWEVWVMNADGTSARQLTSGQNSSGPFSWHPSGTKVYYTKGLSYHTIVKCINIDGTGDTTVIDKGGNNLDQIPDISPDGVYLIYIHEYCCWSPNRSIRRYNLTNGSDTEILADNDHVDNGPRFSPDGVHIIWAEHKSTDPYQYGGDIWRMNADGTSPVNLTGAYASSQFADPAYSSNGSRIVACAKTDGGNTNIFIMNADGSGLQQLTSDTADEMMPDIGMVQVNTVQKIVYSKQVDADKSDLWLMNPDGTNQVQLTYLAGHEFNPKISPDGSKIAFTSNASGAWEVWVMNADGTNARQLTSGQNTNGPLSWHPSGTKIYYANGIHPYDAAVRSINVDGTGDTQVFDHVGYHDLEIDISPDGDHIVYIYEQCCWTPNRSIRLRTLSNGNDVELLGDDDYSDFYPHFSPDGTHILWTKNRSTNPHGFGYDIWQMNTDGSSQVNLTGTYTTLQFFQANCSSDGTKIAMTGNASGGDSNIYIMNADGSGLQQLTSDTAAESSPDIGMIQVNPIKIAFIRDSDIWITDEQGTTPKNLTNSAGIVDYEPDFSADGQRLVWISNQSGRNEIWVMNADGSNKTQVTNNHLTTNVGGPRWSSDSQWIYFGSAPPGDNEVWKIKTDGTGLLQLTNVPGYNTMSFDISHDGTKATYVRGVEGNGFTNKLYVCNSDFTSPVEIQPNQATYAPVFSYDNSKIAYSLYTSGQHNTRIINVDGTGDKTIAAGTYPADWHPSGNKLLISQSGSLYWINTDGTNLTLVTQGENGSVSVSPSSTANSQPSTPRAPQPASTAANVSINPTLSWTGGDPDAGDTVTYDVYFGTDPNPPLVSSAQSALTYSPSPMAYGQTYYWKIVAKDNNANTTTGPIWSFTTLANPDSDSDGLPDAWEQSSFGNLDQTASGDADSDGLTNLQEYTAGTNPASDDSDGDGIKDGWEAANGLNPLADDAGADPDGDKFTNGREFQDGTDPNNAASHYVLPAVTGRIPDTGQTKCYDNTQEIPCPQEGQAFYGQDGNYLINPPQYIKMDGQGRYLADSATSWAMVYDVVTGLIWENKTDDGSIHDKDNTYTWDNAQSVFIAGLNSANFGGHADWRLPTPKELASIVDRDRKTPWISNDFFYSTSNGHFWTSSPTIQNTANAWDVSFDFDQIYGDVVYSNKFSSNYVRAVRGAATFYRFVNNGDGTVTDTTTGLMWQQTGSDQRSWELALNDCENLIFAGFNDWRLPNALELQSTADYNLVNPSIDTNTFPGAMADYYWSSSTVIQTTSAYNISQAWYLQFTQGVCGISSKANSFFRRSVRGGQPNITGNLYITSPLQASFFTIGQNHTITWDTAGITGNVAISLSRDGGKTYETITASTPNDGSFDWTVTGPTSVNCALKIEPLSDPTKATVQSLFTIKGPGELPYTPSTPAPAHQAANISIDADLSWTGGDPDAGDIVTYDIYFGTDPNPPLAASAQSALTYSPSPMAYGQTFYWKIVAADNHGNQTTSSVWSFTTAAAPDAEAPSAPTTLQATPAPDTWTADNTIQVTWTAATDNVGVAGYSYLWDTNPTATPDDIPETSGLYAASGVLADGGSYYFHIRTVDVSGNASATVDVGPFKVDTTAPPAPIGLISSSHVTGQCSSDTTIDVAWADPTGDASGIGGYAVAWDTVAGTLPSAGVTHTAIGATSPALAVGAGHYVHVRTKDGAGNWSATAAHLGPFCITNAPASPQNLSIVLPEGSRQLTLRWTVPLSSEIQGYNIYRSDAENGFYVKIDNATYLPFYDPYSGAWYQTFTDTKLINGITYWYKITAVNTAGVESGFSNSIGGSPKARVGGDFSLAADSPLKVVESNGSVSFNITTTALDRFAQPVTLQAASDTLPPGVILAFSPSATVYPTGSVTLSVTTINTTPGTYSIMVSGFSGILRHDVIVQLTIVNLNSSSITQVFKQNPIRLGEPIDIWGQLLPFQPSGTPIGVFLKATSDADWTQYATQLDNEGSYSFSHTPANLGQYQTKTRWAGTQGYPAIESEIKTITVKKGLSSLKVSTTTDPIEPGTVVAIQVELEPALFGVPFNLEVYRPGETMPGQTIALFTGTGGKRIYSYPLPSDLPGVWKFKATWSGNDHYIGAISLPLVLYPGVEVGEALIVAGGGNQLGNTLWDATEYLANHFYRVLKERRFADNQIHYISPNLHDYDLNRDGTLDAFIDDRTPTVADIQAFIEGLYLGVPTPKVNANKPLIIYMVDHGGIGKFKVNEGTNFVEDLLSEDLDRWLDALQLATGCKVIVIVEACHSGTFIQHLAPTAGQSRVLISSSNTEAAAYYDDGVMSFSQYFLEYMKKGYDLRTSFINATNKINARSSFFVDQNPQLNDGQSGALANSFYVGGNLVLGDILPEIVDTTAAQVIDAGNFNLHARVSDLEGLDAVWVSIMPPGFTVPNATQDFDTPVVDLEKVALSDANQDGIYDGTYNFRYNGTYVLTFFVRDAGDNVVAREVTLTVVNGINPPSPGDVNADGSVTLADAILALKAATGAVTAGITTAGDVNGDGKIGLPEAVYAIQKVAGMR